MQLWMGSGPPFERRYAGRDRGCAVQDGRAAVLGCEYRRRGWVQQYHIGALRNNNTPMFERLGPDIGFDSINDAPVAQPLSRLLDAQSRNGGLTKTILYCLNPRDNEVLGTMIGNFGARDAGQDAVWLWLVV